MDDSTDFAALSAVRLAGKIRVLAQSESDDSIAATALAYELAARVARTAPTRAAALEALAALYQIGTQQIAAFWPHSHP